MLQRFAMWAISAGMTVLGANVVSSQPYPNKPIRVVTAEVGGAADIALRIITPLLSSTLGQQVIVDNRTSAVRLSFVIFPGSLIF
jgi:tripartite-type tricarboxylate transporter receptor subunit TctC